MHRAHQRRNPLTVILLALTLALASPAAVLAQDEDGNSGDFSLDTGDTAQQVESEFATLIDEWKPLLKLVLFVMTVAAWFLWREKNDVWKYFGGATILVVFGDDIYEWLFQADPEENASLAPRVDDLAAMGRAWLTRA